MVSARSRRSLLAWVGLLGVVAGLMLAARPGAAVEAGSDVVGDARRGEAVYGQNCAQCHGGDARGGQTFDGRPAPPLVADAVSLDYIDLVMKTGRMPPRQDAFDNRDRAVLLSDQEQADIAAFMQERFGLSSIVGEVAAGDAGSGLEVYARNCASCHGATGAGGVAGAGAWTPRITGYDPETIAQSVRVGPFQMPAFDGSTVSEEEVGDIAAFLATVEEEDSALLFGGELNPVYASGFAVALTLVVVVVGMLVAGKPVRIPDDPGARHGDEPGTEPPAVDSIADGPSAAGADEPADALEDQPDEERP
jgi:ubiquinol-cytochrome c reductase cytochrome c subunit